MRDVENTMSPLSVRAGTPKIEVVEHGHFVPAPQPSNTSTDPAYGSRGGIFDATGQPVAAAYLRRAGRLVGAGLPGPVPVGSVEEVDEEVVYLGWQQTHHYGQYRLESQQTQHYGHFLLESLARVWFLREIDPATRVVFHTYSISPHGPIRRLLELMGIPDERLLIPQVPTRFRRIIIPEALYELSFAAHERFVEPFRSLAGRIVDATPARPSSQPVYLSRRRLPKGRREIFGEGDLEEVLRESGFRVAHPEHMSVEEQILLFNNRAHIFASVGSAAHAILFSLNQPRLHLLTAGCPKPDYFLVSDVAEVPTTLVHCLGEPGYVTAPQLLDIPLALAYLGECGLLTRPPSAELMERLPALRNRFDEAETSFRVRQATMYGKPLGRGAVAKAAERATTSWVVSWSLARYYLKSDPAKTAEFTDFFTELVLAETDRERIERYGVGTSALSVVRAIVAVRGCAAAKRLVAVLVAQDMIDDSLRARAEQSIREAAKASE
jgi:hypothetical protein